MILVYDIGTTAIKGALFSSEGVPLRWASRQITIHLPVASNRHESDPDEWLRIVTELNAKLLDDGDVRRKIAAVAVSGNGPTLVAADREGKALGPALTWLDRRSTLESEYIRSRSGILIDPSFYLPKALWIARNQPERYERTAWFLSCSEYVVLQLTGNAVMVFPGEGLENFIWTEPLIAAAGLDAEKFPPAVEFGAKIGTVTAEAAARSGIPVGIPVFAAGPDFVVSLLGTAATQPGRACDRAGTSEGINICAEKYVSDTRLMCYRHVIRNYWNVTGIISTSGKALEWFRQTVCHDRADFPQIDARAAAVPAGSGKLLFLPYLSGERAPLWDPHARGMFLGLSLSHTVDHMARAVLESTGFAIRDILTVMEEDGVSAEELRITGTPARSDVWNQIKADITGKRILVPEVTDSELVGDTCLVLHGLGRFGSLAEASEALVKISRVFEPGKESAIYDELFALYRETYRIMKPVFADLAAIDERRPREGSL